MARSNNGSVSAYAAFEQAKGVKGIGTFVPQDLYALMSAVRPNVADGAIIKEALVEFVNARRDDCMNPEIPVAYELPGRAKKESAEDKAKREAREANAKAEATAKALEEALAQIEALKAQIVPPTPPAVIADATTGRVRAK